MPSFALLSGFITSASAHGYVQGIVAGGTYYSGYLPNFQYRNPVPIVAGWSDPDNISNGFVAPSAYSDPDIVCHLSATPGGLAAKVSAGEIVELQWTVWPASHHGPVLDYIAKCPGDSCKDVDKSKLKFVKIGEVGLVSWDEMPGKWASDELISNNNSWSITIPSSLPSGSYVVRHEIIALHSANGANGAQNYPQCINIDVTSSGTEDLSSAGVPATELYKSDEPGIAINIYRSLSTYSIPGPTLWSGAAKVAKQTGANIESYAEVSTGTRTSYAKPTAYTSSQTPSYSRRTTNTAAAMTTTATPPGPSPYSKIAALIDTLPSGVLTRIVSSAPAKATDVAAWGERPTKDLPEGWTMRDLLGWVQYLMKQAWESNDVPGKKRGAHVRDFGGRV